MPAVAKTVPAENSYQQRSAPVRRRGKLTVFLCQRQCIARAFEVRTGHHEFGASHFLGSADHGGEVIRMFLSPMISAPEYGIGQVDANLLNQESSAV